MGNKVGKVGVGACPPHRAARAIWSEFGLSLVRIQLRLRLGFAFRSYGLPLGRRVVGFVNRNPQPESTVPREHLTAGEERPRKGHGPSRGKSSEGENPTSGPGVKQSRAASKKSTAGRLRKPVGGYRDLEIPVKVFEVGSAEGEETPGEEAGVRPAGDE